MVSEAARWSKWLHGKQYDVRAVLADVEDTVKITQFSIRVQIRNRTTGQVSTRLGLGSIDGQVFVKFQNKRLSLRQVLELENKPVVWSNWQSGKMYDVRFATSDLVRSSTKFRTRIQIRNKAGVVFERSGYSIYISDTAVPTYVSFQGKKLYIPQILELEE